ncbi:MAG: tetratricopeptide repeat protein [Anaeromyxobacter sp.]
MNLPSTIVAAVALAIVAAGPRPAGAAPKGAAQDPVRQAEILEAKLSQLEAVGPMEDEDPSARRVRKFAQAEIQFALRDWMHTGILLAELVDDADFRASRDYPRAVFMLAEALREQGACVPARVRYDELLAIPAGAAMHPAAVQGAMACAVKEGRPEVVGPLYEKAKGVFPGGPPPEVRYLAAKSLYQRTDLPEERRQALAAAALADVPAPYLSQARYLEGVMLVEKGDLDGARVKFEGCSADLGPGTNADVAELCTLAVARLHADAARPAAALDWYARIPRESPRFTEALYEIAWNYVKAKRYDEALKTAELITDLAPETPLAPEATILQGHLLLKLDRHDEAIARYEEVITTYAPIRDEIDAILSMHEDPVRYFNELIGRQGKSFDVASVLPPAAVKWTSGNEEVATALDIVGALDASRRDAREAGQLAERIDLALKRGDGIDAFPSLQRGYASAEAIENGAALLEGEVAAQAAQAAGALEPERRAAFEENRARAGELQARLAKLPRSPEEAEARLKRLRERLDLVDRYAFQLTQAVDGLNAAITGSENWLQRYRGEITGAADDRGALSEELREHRRTAERYAEEAQALRDEIAKERDAVVGSDVVREEAALRDAYLEAVAKERELLKGANLAPEQARALAEADTLAARLAGLRERARAVGEKLRGEAARRAVEVKRRVAFERSVLDEQVSSLDGVQVDAKDLVGRIAFRAFGEVRGQFYRLVLKADVGLIDVAWTRKRERLDKIQELSKQKGEELQRLDRDYRALLREVN